ncbi:hypothetical protein V6N11_039546 [Hibiscus sabdariffa]|uniref:Uncharacterized protein n=1 Tax=Hibiscus sabdariffa TaxID=183260 RepID=A0ABR2SN77_9ROSI
MRLSSCGIEGTTHHYRILSPLMIAKTTGLMGAVRCSMGARSVKEGGWFQVIGAMEVDGGWCDCVDDEGWCWVVEI